MAARMVMAVSMATPGSWISKWNALILGTFLLQTFFDLLDLLLGKFERIQVRAHQELLGCRERQALPPGALFRSKGFLRRNQVVAVQHARAGGSWPWSTGGPSSPAGQ